METATGEQPRDVERVSKSLATFYGVEDPPLTVS